MSDLDEIDKIKDVVVEVEKIQHDITRDVRNLRENVQKILDKLR